MHADTFAAVLPTGLHPPSLRKLVDCLQVVSPKWFVLGLQLNIPVYILHIIEEEHARQYDSRRCLVEVLRRWLTASPQPSWEAIASALNTRTVGERRLAEYIKHKYM